MELVLLLLPVGLIAAALGRWTRLHPLAIAPLVSLVPASLAMLAMAAFATELGAILLMGAMAFVLSVAATAFAAFMGWLSRKHIERIP